MRLGDREGVVVAHPTLPLVRVEWEDGPLLQWVDDLLFLEPNP